MGISLQSAVLSRPPGREKYGDYGQELQEMLS